MSQPFFPADLASARAAFRAAIEVKGGKCHSYPIAARGPRDEELTIDVGYFGNELARRVVIVSSGLHGAEGYFGSAVQTSWLQKWSRGELPSDVRLIMPHALNPFGFAWRRRWNENNVDLNRNFLLPGEPFAGSPPLYAKLNGLLNTPSPPSRYEPFLLKAGWAMLRHGTSALAQAIPPGQYEFPQGLFYGGSGPEETQRIVEAHMAEWLAHAQEVLHLDLHTGLGQSGTYQLLIDAPPDDRRVAGFVGRFGKENVSANRLAEGSGKSGVIYASRGTWEKWCLAKFADRDYRFATAEFGTYPGPRMIAALRAENRAWHYGGRSNPAYEWTRSAVMEAFAPASKTWREAVVRQGVELVDRAIRE